MKSERILVRWGLVSLNGGGPYLAGMESSCETRTSTPLMELDLKAGTALTASGRPYRMQGDPEPGYGLLVAREVWGQFFDLSGSTIEPLSPAEARAMVAWRRNEAITPDEAEGFAERYGIPRDPEDIVPWGSGNVFHDLGLPDPDMIIPDPEDGEDADDLPPMKNDF